MTINELRNAPPQTKQYLDAQLLSIGYAKAVNTARGQRNVQELQVVDQQGVQEKIAYWYDIDKPDFAMPQQQINQWLRWVVKTKPNGQYLNISGYPEKQAAPPQQSYTPPPQAPSPQQQQAFNREMEQPEQPDWDEIARGKVRCNLVCAVLQSGENPDIEYLDSLMDYIFTGNTGGGANPNWGGDNPPPPGPGDEVPF